MTTAECEIYWRIAIGRGGAQVTIKSFRKVCLIVICSTIILRASSCWQRKTFGEMCYVAIMETEIVIITSAPAQLGWEMKFANKYYLLQSIVQNESHLPPPLPISMQPSNYLFQYFMSI